MAGSLTWRSYTNDNGISCAVKVDESNANAAVTGGAATPLLPIRTANLVTLPRYTKMRYVLAYNQANPIERRKFYVGNPTLVPAVTAIGATLTAEDYPGVGDTAGTNVTWVITAYRGEKSKIVPAFTAPDTGLTDGTVSQ
jgi:hypothetical protein